jgi:hypothetical protein
VAKEIEGLKKEYDPELIDENGVNHDFLIQGYNFALHSATEIIKEIK